MKTPKKPSTSSKETKPAAKNSLKDDKAIKPKNINRFDDEDDDLDFPMDDIGLDTGFGEFDDEDDY